MNKFLVAAALLLPVCPSARLPVLQAQMPDHAPAAAALRPVRFPPFVNGRLPNGVSTIVVAQHEQPVITISLALPAGAFYQPAGKEGLANLVATLLTKGTSRRTADQLSEEIESAGGSIGASADDDFLTISVSGLSQNAEQLFDILGDVVQHANFPSSEVDLARTQALSGLQASLAQPAVVAGRIFGHEIYGDHPYGRVETPASLRSLTREDVVAFAGSRIKPVGALLVVAGDITPARAAQLAAGALGGWRGTPAPAPAAPALPTKARTEIVLVNKPGAVQSNIVAGFPFITPRDPAVYALTLANGVLGGGSDARLFMILREQKGWTYGAYSSFSRPRGIGTFTAGAEVRTPVTDSALAELIRQVNRIRDEAPADSEVANAKNYRIGRFPLQIETADDIAARVANARLLGLPDDYVVRYRERLAAVTIPQITAAAKRYFTTDRMTIVVVGDGQQILAGLKAIGPVRIVSQDGTPMTEADLSPRVSAAPVDASRIRAGTSEYRILVQGNAMGTETRTTTRVQEGGRDAWQVITNTQLATFIQQTDTTTVDAAALAPIRVRQGGTQMGQPTFVRLDYANGRVRGQTRTMNPQTGPKETAIDTTAAAGVYDDNEFAMILTALPYAAGARFNVSLFEGGKNTTTTAGVAVTGEENLTVPAGAIACWKVEVTGVDQPLTVYIAKENPAIVRLEIQGAPIAFELTGRH